MIRRAQSAGEITVIVRLYIRNLPDPSQDSNVSERARTDDARASMVEEAQDTLLKQLPPERIKNPKRLKNFPIIGMTVDAIALESLINDPQVLSVAEDVPERQMLKESMPLIRADLGAWAAGYTGAGYAIAIIDTGVDSAHPFLSKKVVSEACYSTNRTGVNPDDNTIYTVTSLCPNGRESQTTKGAGKPCQLDGCDHGTHVAGIAAGKSSAMSGVAKDASLVSIQVFSEANGTICNPSPSPCIVSYALDQAKALDRVYSLRLKNNFAAVNISIGGSSYDDYCDSDSRKSPIDTLRSIGIATVIASGNEGLIDSISAPACISSAISVGAVTKSDKVASYSNSASFLSLLAPGGDASSGVGDIYSSLPNGTYGYLAGTSMAAPHVAGAIAILKQRFPSATVSDHLTTLQSTGMPVTDSRNDVTTPRVNFRLGFDDMVGRNIEKNTLQFIELTGFGQPYVLSGEFVERKSIYVTDDRKQVKTATGTRSLLIDFKNGYEGIQYGDIYSWSREVTLQYSGWPINLDDSVIIPVISYDLINLPNTGIRYHTLDNFLNVYQWSYCNTCQHPADMTLDMLQSYVDAMVLPCNVGHQFDASFHTLLTDDATVLGQPPTVTNQFVQPDASNTFDIGLDSNCLPKYPIP